MAKKNLPTSVEAKKKAHAERNRRYRARKRERDALRDARDAQGDPAAQPDMSTPAGCIKELEWLMRDTRSRLEGMSRDETSARAEYRKQLEIRLSHAHNDQLERLVAQNEALNDELDRVTEARQGHAVRTDTAVSPRPVTN